MLADFDTAVRLALYHEFVRTASPPTAEALAASLQSSTAEIRSALERLAAGKAIVLQPESRDILMANPLCALSTPFRVQTQDHAFFGSCVWDGLGIMAMLRGDAVLDTSCACCGEAMTIGVREEKMVPANGVIHFAIPAKRWWENIVFT